jgi:hypothetical protein
MEALKESQEDVWECQVGHHFPKGNISLDNVEKRLGQAWIAARLSAAKKNIDLESQESLDITVTVRAKPGN